jgi:POT family proton-dependent oligopeptide transporter
LALGAALFKPIISATIAKTTNESNSSVGFGIFYMMVNIGAFWGPIFALYFKNQSGYECVFYISAAIISLNFLLLLFYKEPGREKSSEPIGKMIYSAVERIIVVFIKDPLFLVFLIILGGFWTMYYQLFYTLPVFIEQWVDTHQMYLFFQENIPFIAENYAKDGIMDAEFITNFDAFYIIIFQIPISALIMKWKPLNSMVSGFIINAIGMALTVYTQNVIFLLIALFIFGIGEMMGSPKITEYIGMIAPRDKKALYMGFSFIPVFIGSVLAGHVSGDVYQQMSDKHEMTLALADEHRLSFDEKATKHEIFTQTAQAVDMSPEQLTQFFWEENHPEQIWMVVLGIGLAAALLLWIFNLFVIRKRNP